MPVLTHAPLEDWLRLWHLVQQSLGCIRRLLPHFATPGAALEAEPGRWRTMGVSPGHVSRLARWQDGSAPDIRAELTAAVAADRVWCEATGNGVLAIDHESYPALLREIDDPPPLLFFRGDPMLLGLPQVAIVGTRHPSITGRADAEAFASELVRSGLVITSGLARGVDAAAHHGAVQAGGRTIAVLGTGVDRPYPRENLRLFHSLLDAGGLVVSEFLPGEPPRAMHFPRRNRVISGLSLGVLVVEAAPESGSLITARRAAEQGRPVWALPGSRHNVQAQGCLKLLRDGAAPVTEIAHILADLPPLLHLFRQEMAANLPSASISLSAVPGASPARVGDPVPTPLSPEMREVLGALGEEPRHPDHVIGATGQPAATVLRTLSRLEIAGLIAAVPGGYARIPCGRRSTA